MIAIFDLDGVILDTRQLVQFAYRRAGANPPDDVLTSEGSSWLADQVGDRESEIRAIKNRHYVTFLGSAPTLPGYDAAQRLWFDGVLVGLLTAAPSGSLQQLRLFFYDDLGVKWPFILFSEEQRTPSKMAIIRRLADQGFSGVYVDDQNKFIDLPDTWKFIHYTGQDSETLYHMIMREKEREESED